ncbi:uncharacterized protein LOC142578034 [Dermacentor variabilis]|uniref:uncharacterized protein LOC142578034 n=1 Tax=Dermacentor variabilis TaxID=34621 RepID=UPI003F5C17CA
MATVCLCALVFLCVFFRNGIIKHAAASHLHCDWKPAGAIPHTCFCMASDGAVQGYEDGTPCTVKNLGYNEENTWKGGICKNGTCEPLQIPHGCGHTKAPAVTLNHPKRRPIGCTFTCTNPLTHQLEFGYLLDGTQCQHIRRDNKRVNGTCQRQGTASVCVSDQSND